MEFIKIVLMPPMASSLKASDGTKVECGTFSNKHGMEGNKINQQPKTFQWLIFTLETSSNYFPILNDICLSLFP